MTRLLRAVLLVVMPRLFRTTVLGARRPEGAGPLIDVLVGLGGPALRECLQVLAERLAGAEQPAPDRGGIDLEDLGELVAIELLPVIHLEQDLLFERQCAQGMQ